MLCISLWVFLVHQSPGKVCLFVCFTILSSLFALSGKLIQFTYRITRVEIFHSFLKPIRFSFPLLQWNCSYQDFYSMNSIGQFRILICCTFPGTYVQSYFVFFPIHSFSFSSFVIFFLSCQCWSAPGLSPWPSSVRIHSFLDDLIQSAFFK